MELRTSSTETTLSAIPLTPRPGSPTAAPAPDPLRATCRLHGPRSLYTRNSRGHYGMFAPPCNGCAIGIAEAHEYALAVRVREYDGVLSEIWATGPPGAETVASATAAADRLTEAIATLNEASGIITEPREYAERTLAAHEEAIVLDTRILEGRANLISAARLREAMDRLRHLDRDADRWPIWTAAQELLEAMEDSEADDSL